MEAIFGTIVGFVAFGAIWFFLLRPKKDQISNDKEIQHFVKKFNGKIKPETIKPSK